MILNPESMHLDVLKPKMLRNTCFQNRYTIHTKKIGNGSTCEVYKGTNLQTMKTVAIKIIKNLQKNYHQKMNFHQQISILKSVNHPNIVKLEQTFQIDNDDKFQIKMVFQYLPLNLRQVLVSGRVLTQKEVKNIIIKILQGLKYLEQHNILHRDLKPENILLSNNLQTVKICDFGLSRKYNPEDKQNQRQLSHHVMTRWYRAPQVILLLTQYSSKVDIWSFGCIFAELIQAMIPNHAFKKKVLFCGKACFPLSPPNQNLDVAYSMKNGFPHSSKDQLFKILEILGTPANMQFVGTQNKRSLEYLKSFGNKKKIAFSQLISQIPAWAEELLQKTLIFDPSQRISALKALNILKNQ